MEFPVKDISAKNSKRKSGLAAFVLLCVLVVGIAGLAYMKNQDFKNVSIQDFIKNVFESKAQVTEKERKAIIDIDEKEKYSFCIHKGLLIKCTNGYVKGLDKDGSEKWSVPVAMSNPKVQSSNSDLLVYDLGGKELIVISGESVKWSKKLDGSIINADISESGHVCVVQEAKGYKAAVTVFNLQGNEFFTRFSAYDPVFKAQVSPAGKYVAIHNVDMSGVEATSNIELTDMLGKSFAAKTVKAGELFPSLWFIKEDLIVAVNESTAYCIDKSSKEQKEKWKQEFKDRNIFSSAVAAGKYLFLAMSGEEKPGLFKDSLTEVKILNTDGKQSAQFTLEGKVINICTFGEIAALNSGREVYFINSRGKAIGKYTSKVDVNEVHFFSKQQAAVVSKSNVVITEIED